MSGTYDSLSEILTHIETDTTFRAWCISTFGVAIDRGTDGNLSSRDVCRLTPIIAEPEDWDELMWNKPVHLFIALPEQNIPADSACYSDIDATYKFITRFDTSRTVKEIADYVDKLRDCIRRLDGSVNQLSEIKWNNSGAEFFFAENKFPASRQFVSTNHRQSEDD
jgi:hypothetical protein